MAAPRPSYIGPFGKRVLAAGGLVNLKYKFNGIPVYNESGSSIAADKLVAVGVTYDVTQGLPNVVLADANTATHRDIYVTLNAIANNTVGYVFKGGKSAANLDTSGATTVGDPLYLSETAGAFTSTAPTASDAIVLPVGWSTVKSATVGQIHWHIGEREKSGINTNQFAPVDVTGSTVSLTQSAHAFRTVTLSRAAGVAVTLPASSGSGAKYRIVTKTALTSATTTIAVANATDVMIGGILINDSGDTAAATADFYPTAATSDTITLDFAAGEGKAGDWIELEDTHSGFWVVYGVIQASPDPATPFSAAV